MNRNHKKLVECLLEHKESWMTADSLAALLGVSKRSIKTYIAQLKQENPAIVTSSRQGYRIQAAAGQRFLADQAAFSPQTPPQRVRYILTQLIRNDATGDTRTDLYETADQLFVSIETLRKDMAEVRRRLLEFGLYLTSEDSYVSLEGAELDKRKLLSNVLYEDFKERIMSFAILQEAFPQYDLKLLKEILLQKCKQYHYFINEYALVNLLLDIAISIDRIRNQKTFREPRAVKCPVGIREQRLAEDITRQIEAAFGIHYSKAEQEEFTIILLSHLMKIDLENLTWENIGLVVSGECLHIVEEVKDILRNSYFIDVDNEAFLVKFALHIHNLLGRLKNHYTAKNPLLKHIRNTCPLIFESAVEVTDRIREITRSDIGEDEIAYIALHIGANLESQKTQRNKVSCVILFPQYYDFSNLLVEKLQEHFGSQLELKTVVTGADMLATVPGADLVISTIPLPLESGFEWVLTTPFANERDLQNIEAKFRQIRHEKKRERLERELRQISHPVFFCRNQEFKDKEEAISFMVGRMAEAGYVQPSFAREILYRESQASTAFGNIAVPHALKMEADKTGMFVLLNDRKPLLWDGQPVNIILLLAVNKKERMIFHDVYDNLIVLLLERDNAARVMASESYDDFIAAVLACYA